MSMYMGALMAEVLEGKRDLKHWRDCDWRAIPGHFGKPWFPPFVGAYYQYRDFVA
jgi:hypothetical protein